MSGTSIILLKGFGIGLGVAAPIGPVNTEIIRRGLRSGFREPFAVGMGAVTADAIYLALVCLGVSHVAEYPFVRIPLLVLGIVVLPFLGTMAFRDAWKLREVPRGESEDEQKRSLLRAYGVGMALMANPQQIAVWLSFSSIVVGSTEGNPWAYLWFAISVPAGCTLWVIFISTVLHFGRRYVNLTALRVVNVLAGVTLCGFGIYLLVRAVGG